MELWYPGALRRPGPDGKRWSEPNAVSGVICHSMQGGLVGAFSVLDDRTLINNRYYRAASWTFSVEQNGLVLQHYPLDQSPFQAGSYARNISLVGIEHEGGGPGNLSEPLTEPQVLASVMLVRWVAAQGGWALSRGPAPARTLWEHNEVTGTLCPSGRIPWERYIEEEPDVVTKPMDTGATIAAAERIFARFGAIISDQAGETMEEVVLPAAAPGLRTVLVTFRAQDAP